jgi:hypothetical protein
MKRTIAIVALCVALIALPATTAGAKNDPADKPLARAGVFQADDFPAGWRATPHKKSKSDPNACPAVKKAVGGAGKSKTAEANSDDYEQGNEQYTSLAVVLRTEDVARRRYAALASSATRASRGSSRMRCSRRPKARGTT